MQLQASPPWLRNQVLISGVHSSGTLGREGWHEVLPEEVTRAPHPQAHATHSLSGAWESTRGSAGDTLQPPKTQSSRLLLRLSDALTAPSKRKDGHGILDRLATVTIPDFHKELHILAFRSHTHKLAPTQTPQPENP